MKDFFLQLFAYDKWAVGRSLRSIDPALESKAKLLLSHILLAEEIWLTRLNGDDSLSIPTFEEFSIDESERFSEELHSGYIDLINSLSDSELDKTITYKNTKGAEFTTPVREILTHVGLHGVYHRGQIAWLVREGGGTAVNTDFITFTRL